MHIAFDEAEKNPEPVELEPGDQHYLDLFDQLASIRHSSMGAVEPIQPLQITSWAALWQISLTIEEVQLMLSLDRAYRLAIGREYERNRPKK